MTGQSETYLGDGLYASFDGYQIWLRAPQMEGDHLVALEPPVYAALVAFHTALTKAQPAKVPA